MRYGSAKESDTNPPVHLETILTRIAEGITVQDRSGQVIFANDAAVQVLGFASLAELVATPPIEILSRFEIFDETGAPFPIERLPGRLALLGEPAPATVVRFRTIATGDERWSLVKATSVRDAEGRVELAINFFQDITEQKQIEIARRESEEQYRSLVEMAPDVIYSLAPDGTLTALSPMFDQLTGWPADNWIGRPFYGLIHPSDLPLAVDMFRRALQGEETPPHEVRIRAQSGEYLVGELRTRPRLEQGRLVSLFGIARDVTARRRSEAALRFVAEASTRLAESLDFQTTLRNVTAVAVPTLADCCVIHMLSDDGRTLRQVAVAHAVAERAEMVQRMYSRYQIDLDDERSVAAQVMRTGQPVYHPRLDDATFQAIAHDAEHLDLLRRINFTSGIMVPLTARGGPTGVLALMTVDDRAAFRPEDLALAEELGRRASVAIENARLYQEAQNAVRSRNELLSIVSHDLKNPLGAIKAMGQLVKRRVSRATLPETYKIIEALDNLDLTTNKMVSIIDGLLDLARLQSGQPIELQRTPLDLVALAGQSVADHQRLNSHLAFRFEGDVPELIGLWDPSRIERVLTNLVGNAIKYSPADTAISVRLRREVDERGNWAVLSVADQGVGIPPDDLPRIFDRYFRASNVTENYQGAGIGLASVRQIVEQHGGTISVESQVGAGSVFIVRLPL